MATSSSPQDSTEAKCDRCGASVVGGVVGMCPACALSEVFDIRGESAASAEYDLSEDEGTLLAGRYRLGEELGEGGFGVVYRAQQVAPLQREVAIKEIRPGMDTKEVVARFDAERQALALLDHPGIAQIYDAGETLEGRPFFAMELVMGIPITEFCIEYHLDLGDRLSLFADVCDAVQHAHQRGIIHRDLKPSNILVALEDEKPRLKIIDFGIAKATSKLLTEKTVLTEFHQFVGTPAYVSPEQAEMSGRDVDTRSDIYSLGALLYELLTRTPPFDAGELRSAGFSEVLRVIREEQPPKPSTRLTAMIISGAAGGELAADRREKIGNDLDWIVMKALEKDPDRRYTSASDFARDVRRYLSHKPVDARPPGGLYLLRKFVVRHKAGVMAASVALLALIAGLALATYGLVRAMEEASTARLQAERANAVIGLIDDMFASADPALLRGTGYTVRQLLDDYSKEFEGQLDDQPEIELSLQRTIGSAYMGLGDYPSAERNLRRALELSDRLFGEYSIEVAGVRRDIGWALRHQGHYDLARSELEEGLKIETASGFDDVETKTMLVEVHRLLGQHDQSIALAREIRRASANSQRGLNILALAYSEANDFEMARLFGEQALALAIKNHGANHPTLIRPLDTLAVIATEEGRHKDAVQLAREGQAIAEKTLTESHPARLFADARVSELMLKSQPEKSAEELQSLATRLINQMGDNPEVFRSALLAAGSLFAQGKRKEAEQFLVKKLGIDYEALSSGNMVSMSMVGDVVRPIIREGRINDYIPLIEQAHVMAIALFGPEGVHAIEIKRVLSYMYRWAGRYKEAVTLGRAALDHCRRTHGETHGTTFDCTINLSEILYDWGKNEQADALLFGNLEGTRSDADTARFQEMAARYYLQSGRIFEAERCANASLVIRRRLRGNEHPETVRALSLLGAIEVSRPWIRSISHGPLLTEAVELSRAVHGDAATETVQCLIRLARDESYVLGRRPTIDLLGQALERAEAAGADEAVSGQLRDTISGCERELERCRTQAVSEYNQYSKLVSEGKGETDLAVIKLRYSAYWHGMMGDIATAREHLQEGFAILERDPEISLPVRHSHRMAEGWLAWRAGELKKAIELLSTLVRDDLLQRELPSAKRADLLRTLLRPMWDKAGSTEYWKIIDDLEDGWQNFHWPEARTEILSPRGSRWLCRAQNGAPDQAWREPECRSAILWHRGHTPITDYPAVPASRYIEPPNNSSPMTWYFRKILTIEHPERFERFKLRLTRWAGAAVYVNGQEAVRHNLASGAGPDHAAAVPEQGGQLRAHPFELDSSLFRPGNNVLAVEVHRYGVNAFIYFDAQLEGLRKAGPAGP